MQRRDLEDYYNDDDDEEGSGNGGQNITLSMMKEVLNCLAGGDDKMGVGSIFFITIAVFLALTFLTYLNWYYWLKYKVQQQGVDVAEEGARQPWSIHRD